MHSFKAVLLLLQLSTIGATDQCVFYPTMTPPRLMLCQGQEIVSFPRVSESVARNIEEIYIKSTAIKCMDSSTAIFARLEIFAENNNLYWSCECMDNWLDELNHTVAVTTDCQSWLNATTVTSRKSTITSLSSTLDMISSTEVDAVSSVSYEASSVEEGGESRGRKVSLSALAGGVVGVGALAATAIIIAGVKVTRRVTVSDIGGGGEDIWRQHSDSSRCRGCCFPKRRLMQPSTDVEMGDFSMEGFTSEEESEI